uniref:Uncharacterized protein n=1 Tax=Anguilla anguilla TaxID=7936 RepID=A0A0E9VRJ7_ANGAN
MWHGQPKRGVTAMVPLEAEDKIRSTQHPDSHGSKSPLGAMCCTHRNSFWVYRST